MEKKLKSFALNILFPKFCLNCGSQGRYLCNDCLNMIDFARTPKRDLKIPAAVFFACDYQNRLIKNLLQKFKYPPLAKELANDLVSIIITYLNNLEKKPDFVLNPQEWLLVPVPLHLKKLKRRGFNPSAQMAEILAGYLGSGYSQALLKKRETPSQTELDQEKRKNNLKNAFSCPETELVRGKQIIIFDDILTTGTTLKECSKALSRAGAKKVVGLVLAHA